MRLPQLQLSKSFIQPSLTGLLHLQLLYRKQHTCSTSMDQSGTSTNNQSGVDMTESTWIRITAKRCIPAKFSRPALREQMLYLPNCTMQITAQLAATDSSAKPTASWRICGQHILAHLVSSGYVAQKTCEFHSK